MNNIRDFLVNVSEVRISRCRVVEVVSLCPISTGIPIDNFWICSVHRTLFDPRYSKWNWVHILGKLESEESFRIYETE